MGRYLNSKAECLSFDIIVKELDTKKILVEIYIKNNNTFDIFDVKLKNNIPTCFVYLNKTLCIDDIEFYDFMGIENIDIDTLYIGEKIKISYELQNKEEILLNYIDIEIIYRDNSYNLYSETKSKIIKEELFYKHKKNEVKRLKVTKKANEDTAIISEIISYEIIVENISDDFIKNIEIVDIQKKDVEIVGDYIYVNNKEVDVSELSKGIYINYLEKKQKVYIRFKAKVLEKGYNSEIYNRIRISYDYEENGDSMFSTEEFESEKIKIYDVNLDIKKSVNKDIIVLGEELEFKIDIENIGETDCYSINLYEVLSEETEFITGSFYKEDENINIANLENGINIGNLLRGEKLSIYYKVFVKKICSTGYINSQISASFKYKCDVKSPIKFFKIDKKNFKIEAINPGFTEFEIENIIEIENENEFIELIDITQDLVIEDNYIVKTSTGRSIEGIIMNEYKLVVVGILNVCIEYSNSIESEEVYIYKDRQRFVEDIVLAHDYKVGTGINLRGSSNNIYFKKLKNGKVIYKNSNLIEGLVKEF